MMDMLLDVSSWILIIGGCFFLLAGGIGMLRLPDFYTRIHPASLIDTLGVLAPLVALGLQVGMEQVLFKLVLIVLFLMITLPTTTHALARVARHHKASVNRGDKKAD